MTRALIYCRISSDPTGRAAGVQRQETECRELADQLGWEVLEVLVDNDISAYSGKRRPAYEKLMDAIRTGAADAIVAWHTDRLYRRSRDLTELIDIANDHKIAIRTVTSGDIDLSTASGRMMARVVAAVNEHEVEHGQERMKLAKAAAASEGRWLGGPRPFGFEDDGVTVRQPEADEIATAIRRVLLGTALSAIADDWNSRGVRTTRGNTWTHTQVRRMLTRARNAGLIEHLGTVTGKAQWPALVPEHEWLAVRRLLDDPTRRKSHTRDRRHLGTGLYLCGLCRDGARVHAHSSGGQPSYRCQRPGHHRLVRVAAPVDQLVKTIVAKYLRDLHRSGDLRLAAPDEPDLSGLYAEAASIRAQLDAARQALAANDIDLKSFTVASRQWQLDLDAVEERLARLGGRAPVTAVMNAPDPAEEFLSDRTSIEQKRAVVDRLVTVTLLPGKPGRLPGGLYIDPSSVVVERRA